MELFSEVYSCYYLVIAQILEEAQKGITKEKIEEIVTENAFYDSTFHLLPNIFSNTWDFLEKKEDLYFSKLETATVKRPLTRLEKSWLKALLYDEKITLFIDEPERKQIVTILDDVPPLFEPSYFHIVDSVLDKDPYTEKKYIQHFRTMLKACNTNQPLSITYQSPKNERKSSFYFLPYKLIYSQKDDKFRVLGVTINNHRYPKRATLNLSRIDTISLDCPDMSDIDVEEVCKYFDKKKMILLKIVKQRNALERFMLQFASWEKETTYNEEENYYKCKVFYEVSEESELLIRVLSFGPTIKVLGPTPFVNQIKQRIRRQRELITNVIKN